MVWSPCNPRNSEESSPAPQFESINSLLLSFFMVQHSHPYMTTEKATALTIWIFVSKVMFLLFNTLSKFVIVYPLRSKCLWISWLQSPSAVILEPKKKSVLLRLFPILFAMKWWSQTPWSWIFEYRVLSQLFHSALSLSARGSLVPFNFLTSEWYHQHIRGCWYFSQQSWLHLWFIQPSISHYVLWI